MFCGKSCTAGLLAGLLKPPVNSLSDSHGEQQEFCVAGIAPPAMEFTVKAWGERSCADVWTRSGAPAWLRYWWT
jgi:hypothetical protein